MSEPYFTEPSNTLEYNVSVICNRIAVSDIKYAPGTINPANDHANGSKRVCIPYVDRVRTHLPNYQQKVSSKRIGECVSKYLEDFILDEPNKYGTIFHYFV